MIRFIHCADVHLGRAVRSHMEMPEIFLQTVQQATYLSFERIIDNAIDLNVDFVLISGDLYDSEHRSLRAQWFVKKQALRLEEKQIPLFIIHGNHDPLLKTSKHLTLSMPGNVHIFSEEAEAVRLEVRDEEIYIYGFSYPEKAYTENPTSQFVKVDNEKAFHIGMLHGQESMQQDHEPYAPFRVKELVGKGFDYWALGHIHKNQILSEVPPVVYAGNVQGGHRKETGPKGAYFVELKKGNVNLSMLPTAPVEWMKLSVMINGLNNIEDLVERIDDQILESILDNKYFIDIEIGGEGVLHDLLVDLKKQQEFLQILRDVIGSNNNQIWIERLEVLTSPSIKREQLKQQDHLMGDVVRVVDSLKASNKEEEALKAVFSHPLLKRYLDQLSEEERKEIVDHAEKLLLSSLMSNEVKQ